MRAKASQTRGGIGSCGVVEKQAARFRCLQTSLPRGLPAHRDAQLKRCGSVEEGTIWKVRLRYLRQVETLARSARTNECSHPLGPQHLPALLPTLRATVMPMLPLLLGASRHLIPHHSTDHRAHNHPQDDGPAKSATQPSRCAAVGAVRGGAGGEVGVLGVGLGVEGGTGRREGRESRGARGVALVLLVLRRGGRAGLVACR